MKPWPIKPLEEIAQLCGGSTPSRDNPAFWNGNILWLTPTDLPAPEAGISVVSTTKDRISQAGLENSSATVVPAGTVMFSSRATIGKVAVAGTSLTTNQGFVNLIPHQDVTSRFLAYTLWNFRDDIARLSGSTTFREVSRTSVRKYRISVPPLAEQERIVKLLDEADELRKLRAQADGRTADLIPALFHEMFGDPSINEHGWRIKPLAELCISISDIDHKMPKTVESGIPFISAKDLLDRQRMSFENVKMVSQEDFRRLSRKSKPAKGDIIYSRIGARLGKARMVEVDFDFLASYSCCTIKPNLQDVDAIFLCWLLDSPSILKQAHKGVRAIAVPDLGINEIKNFRIISPPIELQREFAKLVTEVRELETKQSASQERLAALFQSMLHRAFRGEL